VSALQANSPKRLAKQFIALAAMKFVKEIFKVAGWRLLVALQSKQSRDFAVVKFVHFFQRRLRNRIFPKFIQIILQLPIRVEEPGTYRSF
jgi:hypothetical protein